MHSIISKKKQRHLQNRSILHAMGILKLIGFFAGLFKIENHQITFPDTVFLIEYGPRTSGVDVENDLSGDESTFDDNYSVATRSLNRRAITMSDSEVESNSPEIREKRNVLLSSTEFFVDNVFGNLKIWSNN